VSEEYIKELKSLTDRLLRLRQEKAHLLDMLENLEADATDEADALETEIADLERRLKEEKKSKSSKKPDTSGSEQEIVFRF